ncbi:hypothetical protein ACFL6G_09525 [candidate division KSB1 bacterium]
MNINIKKILLLLTAAAASVYLNCTEDTLSPEDLPVTGYNILEISIPDTIWIGRYNEFFISAKVEGEPSTDPINVVGEFRQPGDVGYERTVFLFDNGLYYDNVPGDFIFSRLYGTDHFFRMSGTYNIEFFVSFYLLPFPVGELYYKTVEIINEEKNFPPLLYNLTLPDTIDVTAGSLTPVFVNCFDYSGLDDILSVTGSIYMPYSPAADQTIEFNDSGTGEDITPGDSIFTAVFPHDIVNEEGIYSILVQAEDRIGQKSRELFKDIYVKGDFENYPPVINSVTLPDSMQASDTNILIEVNVSDPNGLTHIDNVYFETYKPDGSPSSGNPFSLWDDGGNVNHGGFFSGDQTAGDGVYSLRINLSSTQDRGTYTFNFTAVDKGGLTSTTVSKTIVIY